MDPRPILLILLSGGLLLAALYRITPQRAWAALRGRIEALEEIYRRRGRQETLCRLLPAFLSNLLVGYQVKPNLLEALEFARRLAPPDNPLTDALTIALRRARLAQDKYPALHEAARDLGDPLLRDLFHLLEAAEEEGGGIPAILEAYLEHAYQRKSTRLLEEAKVLPLKLLGITVPLLLPTMIVVMVSPFLYGAIQAWGGR